MTATSITRIAAREDTNEPRHDADHYRLAGELARSRRAGSRAAARTPSTTSATAVTLRLACAEDDCALERLAQLDNAHPPRGPQLVAEVGGQLRAALSLADGRVIANPFHHTSELVNLLRARAFQLSDSTCRRARCSRLRLLLDMLRRGRLAAS
jgi:hypothetical protein